MDINFSDDSMLTDEQRALLRRMRSDLVRELEANPATEAPPSGQGLQPRKEDFPIGISPDGSPNYVSYDGPVLETD